MRELMSLISVLALAGCSAGANMSGSINNGTTTSSAAVPASGRAFTAHPVAKFNEPWAMTFLPSGHFLVTEKKGQLRLERPLGKEGNSITVAGVPAVEAVYSQVLAGRGDARLGHVLSL